MIQIPVEASPEELFASRTKLDDSIERLEMALFKEKIFSVRELF